MAPRPIDVEVRAVGVDGVRRQLKLLGDDGGAVGEKSAKGVESVAGAFLHVAHSGDLAGRELKEVIRGGGEMLGLFGEGGALIGGVVLLGAAFYEAFSKGQEETKKLNEALQDLQSTHLRLAAEFQGNKLGAKSEEIAEEYRKAFREIEKDAPGWGAKILGALAQGAGLGGDFFGVLTHIAQTAGRESQLGQNTYGKGGALDQASRSIALGQSIANQTGLAGGTDPVARFQAQLKLIELERQKAVEEHEMSEEAADARAAGKKEALVRQGYDVEQRLGAEVANALAKVQKNVFDQRQSAEDIRFHDELDGVKRLTVSEADRVGIIDQIRLKHSAITAEIAKQRAETERMGHAQAQQGDLNPLEQLRGQLAAIEEKRKKSIENGQKEVDATRIAENEKREIFAASVDAAVRSNESLGKIATKLALDPLINYLEGLAIQEGIKAIAHYADFDIVGGSLHAAAAAAALEGAHEIAALAGGGGGGGGGRSGSGGGGGLSASSVNSSTANSTARKTTVVFKGGAFINLADPSQRSEFIQNLRDLVGDGDLNFLFE